MSGGVFECGRIYLKGWKAAVAGIVAAWVVTAISVAVGWVAVELGRLAWSAL